MGEAMDGLVIGRLIYSKDIDRRGVVMDNN